MSRYGGWTFNDVARLRGQAEGLAQLTHEATPATGSRRVGGRYVQQGTAGKRPLLDNQFFRSSAEASYAAYLRWCGLAYQYEPRRFEFPGIKGRNASILPDFYLPTEDRYVEVKGYLSGDDRIRLTRLAKYYPLVRLEVVRQGFFRELCRGRVCRLMQGFECPHQRGTRGEEHASTTNAADPGQSDRIDAGGL